MARTVKCPSCGAELTVKDDNRDFMFCEFCGTKVDLIDTRIEHRIVDEARIIEAETDRQVKLKHLEMETEEYEREKQKREKAAKKKAREKEKAQQATQEDREDCLKLILVIVIPLCVLGILGTIMQAVWGFGSWLISLIS